CIEEGIDPWSDQGRVRFDDHVRDSGEFHGDVQVISRRHRAKIEEASSVVELEPINGILLTRHLPSRRGELGGDRARRRIGDSRRPPQIAHHTTPGTFAPGEEDSSYARDLAVRGSLVLDDEVLVTPGVVLGPRRPTFEDETIARDGCGRERLHRLVSLYD